MPKTARASCSYSCVDPELFHSDDDDDILVAQIICSMCPVRAECLSYAIRTQQEHGVWGGTTLSDRIALGMKPRPIDLSDWVEWWRQVDNAAAPRLEPCGTEAAYKRHIRLGEPIDPSCRSAGAEARLLRAAGLKRGRPLLRPHGTPAAVKRHQRANEPLCVPCQRRSPEVVAV